MVFIVYSFHRVAYFLILFPVKITINPNVYSLRVGCVLVCERKSFDNKNNACFIDFSLTNAILHVQCCTIMDILFGFRFRFAHSMVAIGA